MSDGLMNTLTEEERDVVADLLDYGDRGRKLRERQLSPAVMQYIADSLDFDTVDQWTMLQRDDVPEALLVQLLSHPAAMTRLQAFASPSLGMDLCFTAWRAEESSELRYYMWKVIRTHREEAFQEWLATEHPEMVGMPDSWLQTVFR